LNIIDQVMKEAGIVKSANYIYEFVTSSQVQRFIDKVKKLGKDLRDLRIDNKRVFFNSDDENINDIAFVMGGRIASVQKKAWIPGKEEYKYFEDLESRQERIWPDAADSGVLMNEERDLTVARTNIKKLLSIYKTKIDKGPNKDTTTTIFIPFEQDEGYYVGVKMTIYYHDGGNNKINRNKGGYDPRYLNIDIVRNRQKESPFKENKKASITLLPF
jgi:hypothetical protein